MNHLALARPFAPMRLLGHVLGDRRTACVPGAVLLADLANFTGLTEGLVAKAGTDGGELVGRDLNHALGPVIDAVIRHGGEVVKFSGDGLLCIFAGDDPTTGAATHAALEIAPASVRGPTGEIHRFRIAIVQGSVTLARIGGHRGRHELVAGGDAVERAQQLVAHAEPGTIGLAVTLQPPARATQPPAASMTDPSAYLPAYVRARLTEDLSQWLQELRTLTIVFAAAEVDPAGRTLQEVAYSIQVIVDGQGGQLLRFSVEGRCLVAEVAFGLAVGAAATGPREALQCAATLAHDVVGARIGISTGRVLLGPIGSASRRQLTSLGTAVNLAARLMQRALAGEALADEATWAAGDGRFLGTRTHALLKGLGDRAFWLLDVGVQVPAIADEGFFGRDTEMQAVRNALAVTAASSQAIVIQGDAGVGKSRFSRWLTAELRKRDVPVWMTMATPVGRDTPYSGLARVVSDLCGLQPGLNAESRLQEVAARVLGDAARAPLFSDALGLSLPDTPETRTLTGRVRAENIREALAALFRDSQRSGAAALVVDDAHWLDSASWALLQRLAAEAEALHIVIVSRPMLGLEPPELRAIRARGALVVSLDPLPAPDIVAVMAQRMGARDVPPELAQWVVERARGNPFFAQELAAMLIAIGHVEVRDGVFARVPDRAALEALPSVATIESTLEQRIDRLGVEDAVALKVASVIGPTFDLEVLRDLTTRPDGAGVEAVVDRLVAAEMAVPAGPGIFAFRHRYTQEAAYRMLPGDKRRSLHRRVAGWFEERLRDRAEERAGELAHHWFAADDRPKAVQWLERAGMQALRTGADREAATHFRRALSVGDGQPVGRVAAWHRQLARAMFGLGEVEGVAVEARAAVELVARPLPTRPLGWASLSARTALGRVLGPWGAPGTRSRVVEDLLEGARAAGLLAESAYFLNAPEVMVGSALLAVDLAERTSRMGPVSVAYGMLGVVAGMARLHRTARRYLARARALSEAADDPYQLGVAWFYAGMYHGCVGDWDASLDAAQRALALTERLGADMQSGFQLTLIATNALYTSEYSKTRAWMETVRSRAERSANVQQLGWACNVVSVADLHQARYTQAIELSERGRQVFLAERDLVSLIISEGVQCAALAHAGRMDDALASADRATDLVAGARPTTWGQLEGFAGPCEVYGTALAQGRVMQAATQARARTALAGLRLFALVFPFGRARYHWIRGLLAGSLVERATARRHLRRAIVLARRFRMPLEELRATELLAALVDGADRSQLVDRGQALTAMVQAGAPAAAQPEVQAV